MFFKDDIFSYFHPDLCVNTKRRTFEARVHSCCRIYFSHAIYIAIILLFLQMVGVRPTNGTTIEKFADLAEFCEKRNLSDQVFKEVERSIDWVNTTVAGCHNLKWKELFSTLPPNLNQSFLGWNVSCNSVRLFDKAINEIKEQKDFFTIALESYDCKQKYSAKNNCEECSASYSRWLCFSLFYDKTKNQKIQPCLDLCDDVFENCPSFEPDPDSYYGGHTIFECPAMGKPGNFYGKKPNCVSVTSLKSDKG